MTRFSIRILVTVVLTAAVGCAAPVAPAGVDGPKATSAQAAPTFGVIDANLVLEQSESGKKALAELRGQADARRKQLEAETAAIKKLEATLAAARSLTDAERKKREKELQATYQEYQRRIGEIQQRSQAFERELAQKQAELVAEQRTKIRAATKVVAEKRGLTAVFTKGDDQQGNQLVYSGGFVDVTSDVVTELNR